jgi:hypothetical protein
MSPRNASASWRNLAFAMLSLTAAQAFSAPGEDTIILDKKVVYMRSPSDAPAPSGPLQLSNSIPAWMQARMSRYTAKSYSATADDGTIYTDKDVVSTVSTEGFSKTCVQEVASNTDNKAEFGTRYGPNQRDQIVVLRGDLVNICR